MKRTHVNNIKLIIVLALMFIVSCGKDYTPEEQEYINQIEDKRTEKNETMKNESSSPFNYKGKVEFHPLKYYDADPEYVFRSKLYEYDVKDTVTVFGTKGEERKSVRFGYLNINFKEGERKVNVYESSHKGDIYYSIWFTDKTSSKETYGVGRYLNFKKSPESDYEYKIDFNLAFNPYCAYSKEYSCAMPTKEDYLDIKIEAGEKSFHD
ncbi:MAG: DUF1684 domain-containing protein [Melioribacteraceae bacterium]|nr:DUF1684 domain-containing protein [Melioribacteraceae bacterium]